MDLYRLILRTLRTSLPLAVLLVFVALALAGCPDGGNGGGGPTY